MDDKWFKQQQKKVGVTADDIAKKMGRSRSIVSHIYTGRQKMSLEWAKAFAEVLQVPIDEVLKRAGTLQTEEAQRLNPELNSSDAVPWSGPPGETAKINSLIEHCSKDPSNVSAWRVASNALRFDGYLIGDIVLVDTSLSELSKAGDFVLAQLHDWTSGQQILALRRLEPPALVSSNPDTGEQGIHIVDGKNVVIKGKIVSCWRFNS